MGNLILNKINIILQWMHFNKTISIDKYFSDAHYYLGLINESILKYDKAEYHYEKASDWRYVFL